MGSGSLPADVRADSADTQADAVARELRGQESRRYEAAVARLRAAGCRCMLRSDGDRAVPLTTAERDACGRHAGG